MPRRRRKLTIVEQHKPNWTSLQRAIEEGRAGVLECWDTRLNQRTAVIIAVNDEDGGDVTFVPFAAFFNGNPFEMLYPPHPDVAGAFITQEGEVFKPPNE